MRVWSHLKSALRLRTPCHTVQRNTPTEKARPSRVSNGRHPLIRPSQHRQKRKRTPDSAPSSSPGPSGSEAVQILSYGDN